MNFEHAIAIFAKNKIQFDLTVKKTRLCNRYNKMLQLKQFLIIAKICEEFNLNSTIINV